MRTLKFGGTSLSNAKKFLDVSNIIEKKMKYEDISVVLSAPSQVTNLLEKIIQYAILNQDSHNIFNNLKNIFYQLITEIKIQQSNFNDHKIINNINDELQNIQSMIQGIKILKQCPDNIYAGIISKGEIISVNIMQNLLLAKNYKVILINPIEKFLATGNYLSATIQINESKILIQNMKIPKNHIILMPGFIAGNKNKELVILGRNGSDYSAAILSVCLNSKICEIWTDVNGVYTCDPRIVSDAQLLQSISYQEAMELSYFGAKVLHPKTISPLSQFQIQCIIKNTSNPDHCGTKIEKNINDIDYKSNQPIKGITYLNNIVMIQIDVIHLTYIYEITNKLFAIFYEKKISIILKIQSPTENKITLYLSNKKHHNIQLMLEKKFRLELMHNILKSIYVLQKLKIISIIGSGIQKNKEIKTKIFSALEHTDINIIAITNGLSSNSMSIITDNKNIDDNIQKMHKILFNNQQTIELFIIGIGGVGQALIKQLIKQQQWLEKKYIQFKICSISNSKKMIINPNGIILDHWKTDLLNSNEKFCIKKIIKIAQSSNLTHPVIIDCTASQEISNLYSIILSNNIHIVTPNKKANTGSWTEYQNIRYTALKQQKQFLYETNVSAGLPIIATLKNLFNSGDELISFRGILSGSLSFIFGKLEEGISISEATKMAKKLGFTEPNPKDDLSGIDVARKLLILAREAGYQLELNDIKIKPILPKNFLSIKNSEIFLSKLSQLDKEFLQRTEEARKKNKVLRFIGVIKKGGKCQVQLSEIDIMDPLYNVKNGENALTIYSTYYQPIPLVLRGYGAGNDVTAAGIFSDLLRILS